PVKDHRFGWEGAGKDCRLSRHAALYIWQSGQHLRQSTRPGSSWSLGRAGSTLVMGRCFLSLFFILFSGSLPFGLLVPLEIPSAQVHH
ncbi:hypothetical protein OFC47_25875, partial [Escherichia coli]|nr:hypothetical protein [Escherichia coli]